MVELKKCPLCKLINVEIRYNDDIEIYKVKCKRCGNFSISDKLCQSSNFNDIKYILSGISRERFEKGEKPPEFTDENVIEKFLEEPKIKKLEKDGFNKKTKFLLEHLNYKKDLKGWNYFEFVMYEDDYPLAYAKDWREFYELITKLRENGYIEKGNSFSEAEEIRITEVGIERLKELLGSPNQAKSNKVGREIPYVDESRISELEGIKSCGYDFTRLVQMLKELNIAYISESYISVVLLVRAIIDHIPPIFNFNDFKNFANKYGGTKSFKKSMLHLDNSLRNIADSHLHEHIRKIEILPTNTTVNFSPDLDVLLQEIIRVCKEKEKNP